MKKTLLAFITLVALCLIGCKEKRTASPTGFEAKQVNNTIELTWNRVYEADEYCIENISTGMSEYISSTSFIDQYPKEGLNNYELRACGSTYGWSESVYVSCTFEKKGSGGGEGTTSLPAPTGLKLTQTSSYIKLTWNKVSGATSYYVGRTLVSDDDYSVIEETTSTSYLDYDVKSGKTYYYAVAAVNSEGYGELATDYITYTGNSGGGDDNPGGGGGGDETKPKTPSGLSASATSSCIELTWNSVSGATSYNVYRSTSASGTYSNIKSTTSAYYTDCSVTAGTTYYYKVSAKNSAGESAQSSYTSAKVTSGGGGGGGGGSTNYEPCPPTVKCSGSSSVSISWTTSTGTGCGKPTSYTVMRTNRITGQAEVLKDKTTSTSYTDSQPFPGINMYGVTATNDYGSGTGTAISSEIGIKAPEFQSVSGTKSSASITVKELNVPSDWKQYYRLQMHWATSSSGSYTIIKEWKYTDYTSNSGGVLKYFCDYGQNADLSGKTMYYKLRWVFEAPKSPSAVFGTFSTSKSCKH